MSRLRWTQKEDVLIRELKEQRGYKSWIKISQLVNSKAFSSAQRTPKQCRDRYINFSRFLVQLSQPTKWSQENLVKLKSAFLEHGAKWKAISEAFPSRSENNVKNKFYSLVRKLTRRINLSRRNKSSNLRTLKDITVIKCLELCRESLSSYLVKQKSCNYVLTEEKLFHTIFDAFLEVEKEEDIREDLIEIVGASIASYMTRPYKKAKECSHSISECTCNRIKAVEESSQHPKELIEKRTQFVKVQQNFDSLQNIFSTCKIAEKQHIAEKREREKGNLIFKEIQSSSENDDCEEHSLIREADLIQDSMGIFQEF